jgi:DNA-binding NtrC family response regulator
MLRYPRILFLTNDEEQARKMDQLLGEHVALTHADSLPDLQETLKITEFDALLCDWSMYGGTWRNVLKDMQNHDPSLPVIVLSRTGGEKEWVEVIEAGAFDLLVAPYWKASVLAALEHATASREARGWQQVPLQARAG